MPPNEGLPDSVYQNMVCWLKITQKPKASRSDKEKKAFDRATNLLSRMAETSKALNDRKRHDAKARRAEQQRLESYPDQEGASNYQYPPHHDQGGWHENFYNRQRNQTAGGRGTDLNVRRLTDGGRGGRGRGGRGTPGGGRGRGAYAYDHVFPRHY